MRTVERVTLTPAFVLHQRLWRESSKIVEIFSREHGRLGLVARGIRRSTSPLRSLLSPFRPLLLSWTLRGDLGTLTQAEPFGDVPRIAGNSLMAGFYLNELLLYLIPRHDAQAELYDHYVDTLSVIAASAELEAALRTFELQLLQSIGYGLNLDFESVSGEPVTSDAFYLFEPDRGLVRTPGADQAGLVVRGATLKELALGKFTTPGCAREAKKLLQAALDTQLNGRNLKTRDVLRELVKYQSQAAKLD